MADYIFPGEHVYENMVLEHMQTVESIEKVRGMSFVEGDLVIASYPKTGTTWMQEIAWSINKGGDLEEANSKLLFERMPFLELSHINISGVDMLQKMERPAIMKTHLPASLLQKQLDEGRVKVIVTIRNPKDTLVSLFHFYRMSSSLGNFSRGWDAFFELYKTKHILYGDYFDWYSSWIPYIGKPNVQFYTYEDMKQDIRSVMDRLCHFMGKRVPDESMEKIIQHTSFNSMKSNKMVNNTIIPSMRQDISPFIRKGEVGDWKNYFSEEQSRYVEEEYKNKLLNKGVVLRFE